MSTSPAVDPREHEPRPRLPALAWLAATLGCALTVWLFWPGFMSSDSAEQLLQARSGQYSSVHPPLMAMLWSLCDRLWPGPGGLLLLHSALLWGGLAWLASALFRRPAAQMAMVALIGLWPPVLGVAAHLWKDVPMAAFAVLAVAALAQERRRPSRALLLSALVLFTLACAYRHNALPLVLPFAWYIAGRVGVLAWPRRLLLTALLLVAVAVLAALPNRHPAVTARQVWPVTAVWDLAAVSIATERMLIPADWRVPDLSLEELRGAFQPWSNTTVFFTGKLLISLYVDPTPAQNRSLRQAWLALWTDTPLVMLRHRLRLSAMLFGFRPSAVPAGLALSPGIVQLPENPPLSLPPSPLRDRVVQALMALVTTPLFAGWLYAALLAALALSARARPQHPLFWPTLMSVLLFCAPLPLFAPSAEFRYLYWPVLASLLVLAFRCAAPATTRVGEASSMS